MICGAVCLYRAIVSRVAASELDYMIDQLISQKVSHIVQNQTNAYTGEIEAVLRPFFDCT